MLQHGRRRLLHHPQINSVIAVHSPENFLVKYSFLPTISRSTSTQSMNGICAVINNAASCFEGDFINALKGPLKNGYPSGYIDLAQAYNAIQSSIQQGKLQTSDAEQARTNFIVQLNNADMSTEFIETLWATMSEEIRGAFANMTQRESEILESCMSGLKGVKDSLKAVVDFGMQQLKSSAIKPRLNPWVDQFLTYNHRLTEVSSTPQDQTPDTNYKSISGGAGSL